MDRTELILVFRADLNPRNVVNRGIDSMNMSRCGVSRTLALDN